MIWWPYFTLWSKRSLSRCWLLDHILCKWRLVRHYFEWVWVVLGGWDIILSRWGWVGLYRALIWVGGKIFWVGGGGWGWVGEWGWLGVAALFDNARSITFDFNIRLTIWMLYTTTKRLKICIDINIEISEVDHYTWVFNFFT